jgi:guanylate kinase
MAGILFIISAPSGSGKSTLVNELMRLVPDLEFSISYTTRAPRGSEKNGQHYCFVQREEFEEMIRAGDFLEYADVFGNYYGTSCRVMEDAVRRGKDLLLDIDVQGAAQVKNKVHNAVSVFVLPPDRQTLEKRLRNRSQAEHVVSEEIIDRRLHEARKEIGNYSKYDYILVNDRLEQSVDQLKAIVQYERAVRSGRTLTAAENALGEIASECLREHTVTSQRLQDILASFEPALPG